VFIDINEISEKFSPELISLASFLTAFLITSIAIPPIVKITRQKGIYGKRSGRDTHTINIPTLGGVAIFAGFIVAFFIFTGLFKLDGILFLIVGILVVFFTGLTDDIRNIKPVWKLIGEIIASLMLIFIADIWITNLYGFLGINDIGYLPGVLLTLLIFLVIINSFNLIDGIDGLASGIGILSSICFGLIFYLEQEYSFVIISVGLAGSVIAFFYYNVFSKSRKILMGDTGSLILGLLQAVMAIKVLEFEQSPAPVFQSASAPAIVFAILIIPVFDILRVTFLRIIHGRSPFRADSKHIHYRLLALGLNHMQASGILIGINILFIVLVFLLRNWEVTKLICLLFVLAALLSFIPFLLLRRIKKKVIKS
jgi:UDP-GlcNAc:undecaprenyl-phosphate/decaprenyl-phosphate GlcNAc-1-phosphate transferase